VHVFKVEVLPGASTLKHRHGHDFVAVTIGAAELSNEVEGKPPASVKQADGLIRFNEAGLVHLVRNTASTPFRNVTIELLQDDPAHKALLLKWDEESGVLAAKGGSREIVFVKDGARVSSMVLQPGGAQPKRQHNGPEFLVAVTDLELGKGARAVKLKAGEVKWFDTGLSQQLLNTGKQEAKLVLLEFR
jgi:quercetin dioxygenase-like cupin family protein